MHTAAAALVVGALAWASLAIRRAIHYREFARGELPGWAFVIYVTLTIAGLAAAAVSFFVGDFASWLGWETAIADAIYVAIYARTRDIAPFAFYLLFIVLGVGLLS
jgi:hypothetical protein